MEKWQKLYPEDLAASLAKAGRKLYRPSNGTEGDAFMERWCNECRKSNSLYDGCAISEMAFMNSEREAEYPREWAFDNGQPCCTAYEAKK